MGDIDIRDENNLPTHDMSGTIHELAHTENTSEI
jgi:hypothetical protein